MIPKTSGDRFAICVRNDECADLELCKVYRVLPDERAAEDSYLRVIDESGEDYLYPESYFAFVELPSAVKELVALTAA